MLRIRLVFMKRTKQKQVGATVMTCHIKHDATRLHSLLILSFLLLLFFSFIPSLDCLTSIISVLLLLLFILCISLRHDYLSLTLTSCHSLLLPLSLPSFFPLWYSPLQPSLSTIYEHIPHFSFQYFISSLSGSPYLSFHAYLSVCICSPPALVCSVLIRGVRRRRNDLKMWIVYFWQARHYIKQHFGPVKTRWRYRVVKRWE